ncbi:MAG: hypothetical protein AAGF12_36110 [Myxococcota bacterium]
MRNTEQNQANLRACRTLICGLSIGIASFGCGDDGDASVSDASVADAAAGDATQDGAGDAAPFPTGTNAEEIVVASMDGRLTVRIPAQSTQWEVASSDVTIRALAENEYTVETGSVVGAYELSPSGLAFNPPATLEWTYPASESSDPQFAYISSTIELLSPDQSLAQSETEIRAEFSIEHFSSFLHLNRNVLQPELLGGIDEAPLGGQVTVSYRVAMVEPTGVTTFRGAVDDPTTYFASWEEITGKGWRLQSRTATRGVAVLTPERQMVTFGPDAANFLTVDLVWTCTRPGIGEQWVFMDAFFPCEVRTLNGDNAGDPPTEGECATGRTETFRALCTADLSDELQDFIDSISMREATFRQNLIDIIGSSASELTVTQETADALFNNSAFECGDDGSESGVRVVCGDSPPPLAAGKLLRATMNLADLAPTGNRDHSFIYSLVLDSDGDPANNWQFNPPFDFDLFQGTDRWYQLVWDHRTQNWMLSATQIRTDQSTQTVPTGAWATIVDSHINFYVPEAEYDSAAVTYRLTSFGHDGMFSESDRGADVTGGDPTVPPVRPQP